MVQTEGGEELLEFFENINQFHDTIMFTMGWSRHSINYLDVQVIETTVSVTNVVTHNHICPLTQFNVEVTFMFMDWSAKSNRQKQH